jgi:hypothetical protein
VETVWFAIVSGMLAVYAVLDGFDFGAGIVHRFVARTDEERRTVFAAIGPIWDGNEVWLIAAGGVMFIALAASEPALAGVLGYDVRDRLGTVGRGAGNIARQCGSRRSARRNRLVCNAPVHELSTRLTAGDLRLVYDSRGAVHILCLGRARRDLSRLEDVGGSAIPLPKLGAEGMAGCPASLGACYRSHRADSAGRLHKPPLASLVAWIRRAHVCRILRSLSFLEARARTRFGSLPVFKRVPVGRAGGHNGWQLSLLAAIDLGSGS